MLRKYCFIRYFSSVLKLSIKVCNFQILSPNLDSKLYQKIPFMLLIEVNILFQNVKFQALKIINKKRTLPFFQNLK